MMKNILVYGILLFSLLVACSTGDDDDVFATEDMIDWYEVKDKPGEVNQMLYKLYKTHDLTVFINDTIYMGQTGTDHFGNPIVDMELFDPQYSVFTVFEGIKVSVSSDSAAMMVALNTIQEKVIPRLPDDRKFRPRSILLADSVLWTWVSAPAVGWGEIDVYPKSLKGILVGRLNTIKEMDSDELEIWAGHILAVKCVEWIQEHCVDEVSKFQEIAEENKVYQSNYNLSYALSTTIKPQERGGFLKWYARLAIKGKEWRAPDLANDLLEFAAHAYAYQGREDVFAEKYEMFPLVIRKFAEMQAMVAKYEEAQKK